MKNNRVMNLNMLNAFSIAFVFGLAVCLSACSKNDDLKKEDTPELITKATVTFTPSDGGTPVVATATDPDGLGVQDLAPDGPINLSKNQTYTMAITLINGLADPNDAAYKVSDEVEKEGAEHQFFFAWTKDVFTNPTGDGNIDNGKDPVDYTGAANSKDVNGRSLGLTTTWSTVVTAANGTFRVLLKHQPDLKSDTSDSTTGETDLDVEFDINVE